MKRNLSKVDMYPKLKPDVQIKTKNGAYLSLVVGFFMVLLLFSETYQYLTITQHDVISIDTMMNQRLAINVNVTFWGLDCSKVDLVAMDVAGEHQLHIDHDMHKVRLAEHTFLPVGDKIAIQVNQNKSGTEEDAIEPLPADYCGSCYGAGKDGQCCNTCEELKQAYTTKGWAAASIDGDKSEQCKRVGNCGCCVRACACVRGRLACVQAHWLVPCARPVFVLFCFAETFQVTSAVNCFLAVLVCR